jgi:hypothetical protein
MFVATRHAWRLIRRAGQYLGELVDYLMPLVDEKNDDRSGDVDGHSKSHDPKAREENKFAPGLFSFERVLEAADGVLNLPLNFVTVAFRL